MTNEIDEFKVIDGFTNYKINPKGIVVNITTGKTQKPALQSNRKHWKVSVVSDDGLATQRIISQLVLATFDPLPLDLNGEAKVIYKDNNYDNYQLSNLTRHVAIIQFAFNKDKCWRRIQGFSNYIINNHGQIINLVTSCEVRPQVSKGTKGYYQIVLMSDDGISYTKKVHRLVGLAFLPVTKAFKLRRTTIDHRDCNKLNNYVDVDDPLGPKSNLEWVTHKENIDRAIANGLMDTQSISIKIKDIVDDTVTEYASINAAVKQLGLDHMSIMYRIDTPNGNYYPIHNRYQAKYIDDNTPWEEYSGSSTRVGTPISVMDTKTNTLEYYSTKILASEALGVDIRTALKKEHGEYRLINNRYRIEKVGR